MNPLLHPGKKSIFSFSGPCLSLFFTCFISIVIIFTSVIHADEGMIPLSEIGKLDIKSIGLEIEPEELYNPNGTSLIDSIINLSGCTASFVSPDGLMLTNYHCAFGTIQQLSSPQTDYITDGFVASERSKEAQGKGVTARLIESYKDVSDIVLAAVDKRMSYTQRTEAIEKKKKEIIIDVESKNPGRRAEIAEMFIGKTYILFVYAFIKDVRLVYAPPRSIGEFGGESDNWMWPRHTGDFAFLRAYTAPDGTFADYSPNNIPYHPKKYLRIAQEGVDTEDLVFLLGYPGSTFRHRSSYYLSYQQHAYMPYLVDILSKIAGIFENTGEKNIADRIKLASRLKSLYNNLKRSQGQLKAFNVLQLENIRKKEEDGLQAFIESNPARKEKYGNVLKQIEAVYAQKSDTIKRDMILNNLVKNVKLLDITFTAYESTIERKKKDTEREGDFMDRNFPRTIERLQTDLKNYCEEADKAVLKELLTRAVELPAGKRIPAVDRIFETPKGKIPLKPAETIDAFINKVFAHASFKNSTYLTEFFEKPTAAPSKKTVVKESDKDLMLQFATALYPTLKEKRIKDKEQEGKLDELLALLIDVKKEYLGTEFIPDANGTLRFTYGYVRGYSPMDAVYMKPFTTVLGIVEKDSGAPDYKSPEKLAELYHSKDFGNMIHPGLKTVPVAFLYNTDTSGGNSGSPVFNSKGQLIGLNFDRVYEATVNDFAWNESYSRSIGLDIRYILWLLEKYSGATNLLKEMNVHQDQLCAK